MESLCHSLHILFFPYMAQGHMLPMVDMAKLFAARGVKATILTTPRNAPMIQSSIDGANYNSDHHPIRVRLVPFPSGTGLPEGCENPSDLPLDMHHKFFTSLSSLRQPFDLVLRELHPDCVVTDMFLPWTYDAAAELDIPRLVFHGTNFFSPCVADSLDRHKTLESLPNDVQSFVIPGIPHRIEMLVSQIPDIKRKEADPEKIEFFEGVEESDSKSYGVVVNSFYELEPDYAEHFRKVVGKKAWHIGPVSLCNKDTVDKSKRENFTASIDRDAGLKWLDSKSPRSVVYVCFGSLSDFSAIQLREIALGLEACDHPFIWVVRKGGEDWMPEGFEERVEGRGLIIRGWAPQILILNHGAVGGFLTHCGWNSCLEGISAGIPMITWPLFAEQFYNERLIVDVLKIGVAVGVKKCSAKSEEREVVAAAEVKRAVDCVMGGGEAAEERRRRVRELGEMAHKAMEKGGSSYVDMSNLIQELLERQNAVEQKGIGI